jgi:hypothetical protein
MLCDLLAELAETAHDVLWVMRKQQSAQCIAYAASQYACSCVTDHVSCFSV